MRRALFFLATLSLLTSLTANAQALVEYSAAAAAGSAGGAAGKPVSEGVTSVLQKLKQTLGTSKPSTGLRSNELKLVAPEAARPLPKVTLGRATPLPVVSPDRPQPLTIIGLEPAQRLPRVELPLTKPSDKSLIRPVVAPDPLQKVVIGGQRPMLEELASVHSGMTEQEVVSRLGQPAFRVKVSDGSGSVEILQYQGSGREPGLVRISNGVVASVER
jgi:hypothetical protein